MKNRIFGLSKRFLGFIGKTQKNNSLPSKESLIDRYKREHNIDKLFYVRGFDDDYIIVLYFIDNDGTRKYIMYDLINKSIRDVVKSGNNFYEVQLKSGNYITNRKYKQMLIDVECSNSKNPDDCKRNMNTYLNNRNYRGTIENFYRYKEQIGGEKSKRIRKYNKK
jgi:hypothetical protein